MKTSFLKILATMLATFMLIGGCSDSAPAYSHFEQIGSEGWDPMDVLQFDPWPADSTEASTALYDIDLVTRYSTRSKPSRLPVAILYEDADGTLGTDTLVIDASREGESKLGVHEIRVRLRNKQKLTEGIRINISPLSEPERSRGLLNVGIILNRTDN